ncbi:MAG TPA: site-2 protease family protein [Gemmatimonadales bacterium]|nr:site-2 protease family protein [Gemmatimonadales bacterium]
MISSFLLSVFLGGAACVAALLIHEAGHALAALVLGVRIWGVRIGFGPRVWQGTIRGVNVDLGLIPLLGAVQLLDADARAMGYRDIYRRVWRFEWVPGSWRALIISAAGGMANFAATMVLTWLAQPLDIHSALGSLVFYSVLANLSGFLNLLPCRSSDGYHIVQQLAAQKVAAEAR